MTINWKDMAEECAYDFPDVSEIGDEPGDLITIGADLEPPTLVYAYSKALFPMYVNTEDKEFLEIPLGWFSPEKRGIFEIDKLKVSRSMKQSAKKYECKINHSFKEMMVMCQTVPRHGGWITDDFIEAYTKLHKLGFAHSVETYEDGELVGGLYGVGFGNFFAGESMVHTKRDASKVALLHLFQFIKSQIRDSSQFLLDAQWLTPHLASLGAQEVPRSEYISRLNKTISQSAISWP